MRRYLPVHESRGAVVVRAVVPGSLVGGLLVLVGWPVLPTMVLGVVALAGGAFVLDLASAHRRWRASLSPPPAEPPGVGTSSPGEVRSPIVALVALRMAALAGQACEPGRVRGMRVVIAGGHGQIALRLERLLVDAGHEVAGIVRNPDHVGDVQATGAEAVVLDLEDAGVDDVARLLAGADAVVFAAGAGPASGIPRKDTVDRAASVLLADAAEQAGVGRFVQVSSMGAGAPPGPGTDETFAAYLQAKTAAEEDLRRRPLDWTVLRPGGLTNGSATGRVHLAPSVPRGQVPRDDVAAVLAGLLTEGHGIHQTLELTSGDTPVADALTALDAQ